MKKYLMVCVSLSLVMACPLLAQDISIQQLDPLRMQGAGNSIAVGRTLAGAEIKIAAKVYPQGITALAGSELCFLRGAASRLQGAVGVVDTSRGGAMFKIYGDANVLWASGGVAMGATPKTFDLDLSDVALVRLVVEGDADTSGCWLDTAFVFSGAGLKPEAVHNPAAYESLPEWENPRIFRADAEPAAATMMTYDSPRQARQATSREESPWFMSLDGGWKFDWVEHPEKRKKDFYQNWFSVERWDEINVPDCVELQGYGTPLYRNQGYYFKVDPPYVMGEPDEKYTTFKERNAVSSYRRSFVLPKGWNGRKVYLRFDGFASAMYVWVNGQRVGYAEDGRQGATFDITPCLIQGENTLAVTLYRISDGSYMEDQNSWRLSGLYRPVYLWAVPSSHIKDTFVRTLPVATGDYAGRWNLKITAEIQGAEAEMSVEAELYPHSFKGGCVAQVAATLLNERVELNIGVDAPQLWSSEVPSLYKLVLTLKDKKGRVVESIPQKIGFRAVELVNSQILVNGQAVLFKGVNRHEMDPDKGYALPYARMREDVLLMKRLNVNAVYCPDGPSDPQWYDLCDEHGLYVINAANLETQGLAGSVRNPLIDPAFRAAALDRATGMVERDKNHPCIVIWSLGKENSAGSDFFQQATNLIHARDPGRVIQNHSAFPWDFADQGLRQPIPRASLRHGEPDTFWAYGSDFGGYPNDVNPCCNGLVQADRRPTQQVAEVRYSYQCAFVEPMDLRKGRFLVKNAFFFTNLKEYECLWRYEEDGEIISRGSLGALDLLPRCQMEVTLPIDLIRLGVRKSRVAGWSFDFILRRECAWAPKGFNVSGDQVLFQQEDVAPVKFAGVDTPRATLDERSDVIVAVGGNTTAVVSKVTGALVAWQVDGVEQLMTPLEPEFWRAPTSNDSDNQMLQQQRCWESAAAERVVRDTLIQEDPDGNQQIQISFALPGAGRSSGTLNYTVNADGRIRVTLELTPEGTGLPGVPRVGMKMQISPVLDQVTWLGRGPGESYPNRKQGAFFGRYTLPAGDFFFPYVKPQESGNRTDTLWVTFTDRRGSGIRVEGAPQINFSVLPYTVQELSQPKHPWQLNSCGNWVVQIDYGQTGLAGEDSRGAKPGPLQPLPTGKTYKCEFMLSKF